MDIEVNTAELRALANVADLMCVAARTAPKPRGIDSLVTAVITDGEVKEKLRQTMLELFSQTGASFFERDANNILKAPYIVLLGAKEMKLGIPACGFCGSKDCGESQKSSSACAINAHSLGIAVGSAVSVAADHRVDTRVMYTIGKAAVLLGLLGSDVKTAYGIPLSVSGKSPFFDR